MDTVPNPSIIDAAVKALAAFHPESPKDAENMLLFWVRRGELTELDIAEVQRRMFPSVTPDGSTEYGKGYADGYVDGVTAAKAVTVTEPTADCPEWCVINHIHDDERDDLVTHQGDDHADGVTHKLLEGEVSVRVSRTDCPRESLIGAPALYVAVELELTTWAQAAELARMILDGFGYLEGA